MSRQINQLSKFQFLRIDFSSVYKFAITFLPMPLPHVWNILLHTVPFCKPPKCFGPRACFCVCKSMLMHSWYNCTFFLCSPACFSAMPCPYSYFGPNSPIAIFCPREKKTSPIANCQLSEYVAADIRAECGKDKMVRAIILSHFVLGISQRWL